MLKPTKHTNIKFSVMNIAGKVLYFLQKENILKYEELKTILIKEIGHNAKYNINNALTFLYSIGKVEYLSDIDAITLKQVSDED